MIETLKLICIEQIARNILEGKITTAKQKLDTKSSNLVFREFWRDFKNKRFSKSCLNVKNILNVSKMELESDVFGENQCKMVYEQDIQELSLGTLKYWKMFHPGGIPYKEIDDSGENASEESDSDDDDKTHQIDIIAVLKKLLNPDSRNKLKSLSIDGNNLEFKQGWVEELSTLLPSLVSLKIPNLGPIDTVIQKIFSNFTGLSELDISGAKISDLYGISKLQNLTILNVSGINFGGIQELFELKNLRALMINGKNMTESKSKNMLLYLSCEKSLPELTYLSCSNCKITEEMLQELIKSHPKLEAINLIDTPLEDHAQIPGKKSLKLLTLGSFKDCLATIEYLFDEGSNANQEFRASISTKVFGFLDNEYDLIGPELLRECLQLMCRLLNTRCQMYAAAVLRKMCRGERAKSFTFAERQHLIYSIIRAFRTGIYESSGYSNFLQNQAIWFVLANDEILDTCKENIDRICEDAAAAMSSLYARNASMVVLHKKFGEMSPNRSKCLLKNPSFIANLSKLLESYDNDTYLQEILELIREVYELRDDQSPDNLKVDQECVKSFCVAFGNFEFPDPNHALLVEALYTLLNKHMPVNACLQMMEDKKWAPDFIRSMRVNKSAEQSMALRLLYFLYVHCESEKKGSRKELKIDNLDRIVAKEIMRTLEKHRNTIDSSEEVFDRLKWILTISEEPLTRDFVEWIIREFESEEEKKDRPDKRRRTCSV